MFKIIKKLLIIIIVIISIIFARNIYDEKSIENHYISLIGINIPKEFEVIELSDSHGGFHGDGVLFEVIQLEQDDINYFTQDALNTGSWGRLPMEKDLR